MDIEITTIYCITDDWLQSQGHRERNDRTLSDAEVMTVALVAARYFDANFERALDHMLDYGYIAKRLSRSQFNRRLHPLQTRFENLFHWLANLWKRIDEDLIFSLDSFPVSVCDNYRIRRCKIYRNEAFRGKIASKRRYFYGLKVHMIVNQAGLPVEVFFTPGSNSDTAELKNFNFDLPPGSTVYADKAYNEYLTEDVLLEAADITLLPIRKKNSKRPLEAWVEYVQKYYRKRVETSASLFERLLPKSIHAVTARGFELKVFLFILACSFDGML